MEYNDKEQRTDGNEELQPGEECPQDDNELVRTIAEKKYEFGNHLIIDARYHFSLRRLNKVIETDEPNMFNRVFMLTLGYKIGL